MSVPRDEQKKRESLGTAMQKSCHKTSIIQLRILNFYENKQNRMFTLKSREKIILLGL